MRCDVHDCWLVNPQEIGSELGLPWSRPVVPRHAGETCAGLLDAMVVGNRAASRRLPVIPWQSILLKLRVHTAGFQAGALQLVCIEDQGNRVQGSQGRGVHAPRQLLWPRLSWL